MAKTAYVDPNGILTVIDTETNLNLSTTGAEDLTKSDKLKITGNGATLATGVRNVSIQATNDDDTVAPSVCMTLSAKGTSGLLFIPQLAASPTHAAWMKGAIYFNTTDGKLYVNTGSAWAVAGTQV